MHFAVPKRAAPHSNDRMTRLPSVALDRGIHVMHLFYKIDRLRWTSLPAGESAKTLERLEALCAANAAASHPRLVTYANTGGKADLALMIYAKELGQAAQIHVARKTIDDSFSVRKRKRFIVIAAMKNEKCSMFNLKSRTRGFIEH